MSSSLHLLSLLRSSRITDPFFQRSIAQTLVTARPARPRWQQERHNTTTSFERYGTAKDLLPPPDKPQTTSSNDTRTAESGTAEARDVDTGSEKLNKREVSKVQDAVILDASEGQTLETSKTTHTEIADKPLEKVLEMAAPTSPKKAAPPHLEAPRYVHHFDTYTLVNDLKKGGFTQDQSVTIMKAVRNLLAENLEIARQGLVSKSDVENESYLFRAACSELRTEIQSARRLDAEKMRGERALLQHEADILSQKVTQESMNLKDELRGLLDDRKMAAKMEQRGTESRIQEAHYRITSLITGEAKGEVEGLRWYLTRTLVFTLAATVLTGLTYLSISTRKQHKKQEEIKKAAQDHATTGREGPGNYTVSSRSTSTQTAQTDAVMAEMASSEKGTNTGSDGYVSLG